MMPSEFRLVAEWRMANSGRPKNPESPKRIQSPHESPLWNHVLIDEYSGCVRGKAKPQGLISW